MKTTALHSELKSLGVNIERQGKDVSVTCGLNAALKMTESRDKISWLDKPRIKGFFAEEHRGFPELPPMSKLERDLKQGPDMAPFNAALHELQSHGLKTIQAGIANCKPARKRRVSEYDGVWQYDRKDDEFPFVENYKKRVPNRIITVIPNFTISGSQSNGDVDAYGAMVWAICQLIEKTGILVNVDWYEHTRQTSRKHGGLDVSVKVRCKTANQYLAPSMLAACFTSNFFRRIGFALWVSGCNAYDAEAAGGLGSCITFDKPAEYRDGCLYLSPMIVHGHSIPNVKAEVMKAIGATK